MKKYVEKMKRFWSLNAKAKSGFTLVELIVVIAILAILAGVAIPAYSGYVEKAKKAEDEQLLATINTAFAAACIENGTDMSDLSNASMPLNADNAVDLAHVEPYGEEFGTYYAGNETAAFELITYLKFDDVTGKFVPGSKEFGNLVGAFSDQDIAQYNESIFANIGFDALMGQVDMATQVALVADPDSTLGQMIFSEENMESLALYLGCEPGSDEFDAAFQSLTEKKVNQMIAAGADASDMEALWGQAANEILANTAVLVAATESDFDTEAFKTQLALGNGKDTIKSSMDSADGNQTALSQTALAYAMYTSYVTRNGGTATDDIFEVLDVLESDEFIAYMSTEDATKDMDGYLAAMNMINVASADKDAVSTVLVKGFNDTDLIALLNQEIGK